MNSPAPARATVEPPAAKPLRSSVWFRLFRWTLALTTTVVVLGLGAWWFLLTQIVPKIDQWRAPLAQQASKTLGLTVQIGRVTGRSDHWRPELSLEDVRFLDTSGRPALQLPRVTIRLSAATLWPSSIWRKEVHVDRLVLVRPQLDVRRDPQGRVHVAGLVFDPDQVSGSDNPGADWLLAQDLIRIEAGSVSWTDEMRGAHPLQLSAVDVDLHNRPGLGRRVHEWRLAATPPQAFGQRFSIEARLTQPLWARAEANAGTEPSGWSRWLGQPTHASDWRNWSGHVALALPYVDVQSLKEHATLPFDIQGGHGQLGLKLALKQGQPEDLTLSANVQAVSLRLADRLAPLAFKQVHGTVTARHEPTQTTLAWQDLSFTTDDGLVWPASQARLQWQHPPATRQAGTAAPMLLPELQGEVWRRTTQGRFDTDRLDLALLARLADRLPLADSLRQQLAKLTPVGVGTGLSLSWQGPADAPARYEAQGSLSGLSWQAAPEHPGLAGGTVQFKANEQGGQASLTIDKGWAEFPGAFEEPRIPVDTLKASLNWTVTPAKQAGLPPAVELKIQQATFANADAEGRLEATWHTGPGTGVGEAGRYPGVLAMQGQLSRAQGARVWRYLPAVMLPQARHYVRDAVRSGYSKNVGFEVNGPLWLFPFKDDQGGRFRITVQAEDVTLDYVPGQAAAPYWPPFTKLNGQLIFEGQGLRIENATAMLGGVGTGTFALQQVKGRIADLDHPDPVLDIQGQGSGPLNDLLQYMAVSPVGQWTGHMLGEAQGQGRGNLTLALSLPLNRIAAATVNGQVTLNDKDQAHLRLAPGVPLMQNARGQVQFTQDTLKVNARAKVWGQEIAVQGSRDAQGVPRFQASGLVTAEGLRGASEWPAVARLAQRMTGQTAVSVSVALNRVKTNGGVAFVARPELQVNTTLQGLGMDLPAPLTKDAAAAWPLKVVHRLDDQEGKSDSLQVELTGPAVLKADYRRDLKGPQTKVLRGAVSLSQGTAAAAPLPLPPSGVVARVTLPTLDLDAWQQLATQISKASPGAPAASSDASEEFLPDTLSLKAGALSWRQRTLKDVAVTLAHPGPGVWRAQIDAQQLAGQIEMRPESAASLASAAGPTSRVVARLSRLSVPAADAEAFTDQAAQQMLSTEALSVPALDIVIDQFDWRGLPLGKLEVEAVNRLNISPGNAPLPEWRLTKFRLSNADAQLSATGNWAALGAQQAAAAPLRKGVRPRHRAAFSFSLDLNNSGNLLNRLGLPQTLKGGKGKLSGQVAWMGSPLEPDAPSMNGDVNVAISEGQFLKVEPGAAKLLGVLSLQSLPRRLILDFRDVFQQGFAFDRIEGDLKITQGVAATRNLRMRGVQALVLMEGQADLAQETQNLRVFVVPEINAGTASLAYAAINPAIGLGTFIAQVLLRKSIVEANTREFTITGSWSDPQVDKVQRTTVPAAAGDEPATPAHPGVKASQTPS